MRRSGRRSAPRREEKMSRTNSIRVLVSLALYVAWMVIQSVLSSTATVLSAETAGRQFENSDMSAVGSQTSLTVLSNLHLPSILLVAGLLYVWWKPLREVLSSRSGTALTLAAAVSCSAVPAHAFFATTDVTEVVYVLPNWSAFFIPDVGSNKDTQSTMGSIDYLNANKIAAKRFIIPHAKLSGTGGTSMLSGPDYYVPTGRMIIVDRTPFFREWQDAADRGTSKRKEGFTFETRDSVNVGTGITVSAYVTEQNAASFLYWFGTKTPEGDLSKPENQFASVLHGMSLSEVMDGIVRAKVQESLASEFSKRSFDEAIGAKNDIMIAVRKAVKEEFEPKGISIGFLGYAGPLDFAQSIQTSIDQTVVATRMKVIADTMQGSLDVLQRKAAIDAVGTLASKWNGVLPPLPSFVVLPGGLSGIFDNVLKGATPDTPRH